MTQRRWLGHYGARARGYDDADSVFSGLNREKYEYSAYDKLKHPFGALFSMNALHEELGHVNFFEDVKEVKVPLFFMEGRYDYNTPFELVEEYLEFVKAPHKEIIWFEEAAHMIPFEEPEKFIDVLFHNVLEETYK